MDTGSNLAPQDANPLANRLAEQYASLRTRTAELVAALGKAPAVVTEHNVDRAGAFVRQIRDHSKLVEATRENEKKEFLEAGRTVDGFFRQMLEQLKSTAENVEKRMKAYLQAKADAERKVREEEAKRQRDELDRLEAERRAAEEALAGSNLAEEEAALDAAIEAEAAAKRQQEVARDAEKAATAKTADLARTRGALGGTATLATTLDFDITNHRAAATALADFIPTESLEQAVRAYARTYAHSHKGADMKDAMVSKQPVAGVRFYLKQTARVV